MKAINRIVALAALVLVPSVAFADFKNGHSKRNDKYCPPYSSHSYYGPRDYNYGSNSPRPGQYSYGYGYGYNNAPRGNYGWGNSRGNDNYAYNDAIRNGVRSGLLSNSEVRELREDQRDIRQKEARYRSDGYLSPREREALRDDYREFREDLNHELRDGERRR